MSGGKENQRYREAGWVPVEGDLLDGRYRIDDIVAGGGMGVVLLAEHLSMKRKVAVKVLRPRWSHDPVMSDRFLREMHVAKEFSHPHIVQVYDSGRTDEGCLYLVMEWMDGCDLSQLLKRRKQLPMGRALKIWKQILDGLAEAHAMGVAHRDVKPANVFITQDRHGEDHAKVLDFGLAKPIGGESDLTMTGQLCGTVSYMSPEVILEQGGSKPADVYAAALVFLEVLTGKKCVDDPSTVKMIFHHLKGQIWIPDELSGHPLGKVLRRAVAKHPEQRFADADALLQAVDKAAVGLDPALVVAPPGPNLSAREPQNSLGGFLSEVNSAGLEFLSGGPDSSELWSLPGRTPPKTNPTLALGVRDRSGSPGLSGLHVHDSLGPRDRTVRFDPDDSDAITTPSLDLRRRDDGHGFDEAQPTELYSDPDGALPQVHRDPPLDERMPKGATQPVSFDQIEPAAPAPKLVASTRSRTSSNHGRSVIIAAAVVIVGSLVLFLTWDRGDDEPDSTLDEFAIAAPDDGSGQPAANENARDEPASEDDELDETVLAEAADEADEVDQVDQVEETPETDPADDDEELARDEPDPPAEPDVLRQPPRQATRPAPTPPPANPAPRPRPRPRPTPPPEEPEEESTLDPDAILDRYFQD